MENTHQTASRDNPAQWPLVWLFMPLIAGVYYLAVRGAFSFPPYFLGHSMPIIPGGEAPYSMVVEFFSLAVAILALSVLPVRFCRRPALVATFTVSFGHIVLFCWNGNLSSLFMIIVPPLLAVSWQRKPLLEDKPRIELYHLAWLWIAAYIYALFWAHFTRVVINAMDAWFLSVLFSLIAVLPPLFTAWFSLLYGFRFLLGVRGGQWSSLKRNVAGTLILVFGGLASVALQYMWPRLLGTLLGKVFGPGAI